MYVNTVRENDFVGINLLNLRRLSNLVNTVSFSEKTNFNKLNVVACITSNRANYHSANTDILHVAFKSFVWQNVSLKR